MTWFSPKFHHGQEVTCFLESDLEPVAGRVHFVHPTMVQIIVETESGARLRIVPNERVFATNPQEAE